MKYISFPFLFLLFAFCYADCSEKIIKPTNEDIANFNGVIYISPLTEQISDTSRYFTANSKICVSDSLILIFTTNLHQKLFVKKVFKNPKKSTETYWASFNQESKIEHINLYLEFKSDSTYIQYVIEDKIFVFHNCYKIK